MSPPTAAGCIPRPPPIGRSAVRPALATIIGRGRRYAGGLSRRRPNGTPAIPPSFAGIFWNEPELTCGIWREASQENMVCYCAHSVERFILWLRRRYGSLEVLNRRWGRNYQAWEEIEPPRCAATFNDMVDWREFFGETLAEELHMRAKAVRLHDGEHSVMVHTVPMPYFNFMNTGSEEYLLAREMDWFGNSVGSMPFPGGDRHHRRQEQMGAQRGDSRRGGQHHGPAGDPFP